MTREIKFRSWNIEEKRRATHNELLSDISVTASVLAPSVLIVHDSRYKIMQFTGLYDKNNQPIYESDLLRKNNRIYQVKYHIDSYYCGFVLHDITGKNISHGDYDNVEIIGNVYEHTHLLINN